VLNKLAVAVGMGLFKVQSSSFKVDGMSVKKSAVAVGGRQMKAPSLMRALLKRRSKSGDFAQRVSRK
jgi:hypothetical protein